MMFQFFMQGVRIPARTEIMIIADLIHRNDQWFPNPNKFHPERWLSNEDDLRQHPYSYVAFSAGSRKVGIKNLKKMSWPNPNAESEVADFRASIVEIFVILV